MESKKIRKFLSSIDDLDFRYLRIQISMANDARNLIKDFNLTKQQFCSYLSIDPDNSEYQDYIQGGFNYTIMHMARLQAAYCKLSKETVTAKGKFTDIKTEDDGK